MSSLLIAEIKRIIKESEIMKYSGHSKVLQFARLMFNQGGRHQVAREKQGWAPGARNTTGERTHLFRGLLSRVTLSQELKTDRSAADRQDRFSRRRY